MRGHGLANGVRQVHGDGITKLPHRFAPCPMKKEIIREGLEARAFPDGEVPDGTIRAQEHVLAARDPMNSSL